MPLIRCYWTTIIIISIVFSAQIDRTVSGRRKTQPNSTITYLDLNKAKKAFDRVDRWYPVRSFTFIYLTSG